jgi:hypothetical protein
MLNNFEHVVQSVSKHMSLWCSFLDLHLDLPPFKYRLLIKISNLSNDEATLYIPISEGDTTFLYCYEIVPPKDLGNIVHSNTWHMFTPTLGIVHLGT